MSFLPFKSSAPSSPFSIDDAFEIPEDIAEEDEEAEQQLNQHDDDEEAASAHRPIIKAAASARLRLADDEDAAAQANGLNASNGAGGADSASLIQSNGSKGGAGGYYEGPPPVKYWWRHPKIRQNWKVMTAAFLLCFIGVGLIIGGIVAYCVPSMAGIQGAVFLIAGVICFLPGAYHIGYVYLAVKGKRGFEFHHLPLFNS